MFVADAHCDALLRMTLGQERSVTAQSLRLGGVGVQALAIFAGEDEHRGFHRVAPALQALRSFGVPVLTGDLPETPPRAPHAAVTIEGTPAHAGLDVEL